MKEYTFDELKAAFDKALNEGPSDETRNICITDPHFSFCYALEIDKQVHNNTRKGVLEDSWLSYCYAVNLDKQARKDTKKAVLINSNYSYLYFCFVEEKMIYIRGAIYIFNDLLYAKINRLIGWSSVYLGIYPINLFRMGII